MESDFDPFDLLAALAGSPEAPELVQAEPVNAEPAAPAAPAESDLFSGTEPVVASDPQAEQAAQAIAAPDLTAQALLALHRRLSIIEEFMRRNGHL